MTIRRKHSIGKWGVLSGALFAAIILGGCEQGKETSSTTAPAKEAGSAMAPAPAQQPAPAPQLGLASEPTRIEMIEAALSSDPENRQLLVALGDSYFEAQRFQDAIPVYEKAVNSDTKDVDTLNDLGLAYFYTGNPEAALSMLAMATDSAPDYKYAWLSTGYILMSLDRYDEAVTPLSKARELDPDGPVGIEADKFLKKIEQQKAQAGGKD